MESKAPSRQRLFVALDLPGDARSRLVGWQGRVFDGHVRTVRLVRPEALHVTLVFLGHVAEDPIGVVADLEPLGLEPVPPRRPRLWALDLADREGRAAAVQAAIATSLAARGLYTPEKRPFWPHVTVARLRSGARPPKALEAPSPPAPFTAGRVVLYRSHLGREGARYEALSTLELARKPG